MRRPDPVRSTFLHGSGPLALGHRGGVAVGDTAGLENTRVAFDRALALGATHLETDARATRDGVVFAFHDAHLDRLTDTTGAIADLTAAEVRAARVGGRERVPELRDLLRELPEARLNIDVKHDAAVIPTVEAIQETGALERVCLASFSHGRLRRLRRLLPGVASSLSPPEIAVLRLGAVPAVRAASSRAGAVCVQVSQRWGPLPLVDARFVRHAHEAGLAVHVWTVDDPADMTALLDLGVDGIMTDRLDLLLPLLAERDGAGR